MPGAIKAMVFTDNYKDMECLGGMSLQSFLTSGLFVYPTSGTPASYTIHLKIVLITNILFQLSKII